MFDKKKTDNSIFFFIQGGGVVICLCLPPYSSYLGYLEIKSLVPTLKNYNFRLYVKCILTYVPTLCVQAMKALARLYVCAGLPEPWLITYATGLKI